MPVRRLLPLTMPLLLLLAAAPPTARALECVGYGLGSPICMVYHIIIEVREDYIRVEIRDGDEVMVSICVKPPEVWVGNCTGKTMLDSLNMALEVAPGVLPD